MVFNMVLWDVAGARGDGGRSGVGKGGEAGEFGAVRAGDLAAARGSWRGVRGGFGGRWAFGRHIPPKRSFHPSQQAGRGLRLDGAPGRFVGAPGSFVEGGLAVIVGGGEGVTFAGADDAVGHGLLPTGLAGLGGLDLGEGAEVVAGKLEGVKEGTGSFVIEMAGGHIAEDEGDGDLDRLGVFEGREGHAVGAGEGLGEFGEGLAVAEHLLDVLDGHEAEGVGRREALGMGVVEGAVEVAEGGAVDGRRLAAAAVGLDVAANGVLRLIDMGCHGVPLWVLNEEGPQADACGPSLFVFTI